MKKTILSIIAIFMAGCAMAVPAFPGKVEFRQPGSEKTVTIFLKGDEKVHWAESVDGYSLLHGDNGALYYAIPDGRGGMQPSDYEATEIEQRSTEVAELLKNTPLHLSFSKEQVDEMKNIWKQVEAAKSGPKAMSDVIGEKKFLVILFAFTDQSFSYGKQVFKNLFNQVNYSSYGAKGSVHDYYYEVSKGLFSLHVDVVGPYTGTHNTAYYGNTNNGYQHFAHEAVDSAAQDVNFADYDNDGDGYIDGLHIIFAGHGEEAGGSVDYIWSHKWNIFNPPTYNNTVIDVYSCSPECSGSAGSTITAIGVICHELGHVFGAPDYYDTDYESNGEYPGLGQWDIMSSGSWNRGGKVPAQHNPYTKLYIYHWGSCDTLNGKNAAYIVDAVDRTNNDFHRVNTSTPGDFFLLENRQKIKWDKNIPGHGLLVYHIHPNANGANVTNHQHPQQIYIVANTVDTFPNSSPSSYGVVNSELTPYSGIYGMRDSLTDFSVPWFRPWSKQPIGVPIRHVSEDTENLLVYFTVGNAKPEPMNVMAEGVSNSMIRLDWKRWGSYNTFILMSETSGAFGIPDTIYSVGDTLPGGGIVIYDGTDNKAFVDSLQSGRTYYFKVFSRFHGKSYSDGVEVEASTLNCNEQTFISEDFEEYENGEKPDCWIGQWGVYTIGWQKALASTPSVASTEYQWQSIVTAPVVMDTIHHAVLHFKYLFGGNSDENSLLCIEYKNSLYSDWDTLATYNWLFGMATWAEVYLPLAEAGDHSRVRFSVHTNGAAFAAIDNVEIMAGALIHSWSDDNGDIYPRGYNIVEEHSDATFTITPLPGYHLKSIKNNNISIDHSLYTTDSNGVTTLTMSDIQGKNEIYAVFEANTSIDVAEGQDINIYPNPSTGIITVESPVNTTLTVYDIMGALILRKDINGSTTIDLTSYPTGIYIVRCGSKTTKVVRK